MAIKNTLNDRRSNLRDELFSIDLRGPPFAKDWCLGTHY